METRSNHVLVGTVTLLLLAAIIIAAFWFSRISDGQNKQYDIFFKQSVSGLAKGSSVNYAGVPSGQVESIDLWKRDPSFVRVRITVKDGTPVLQGTTASIAGVGFTGVSEVVLDGAVKGAPPIICPAENPQAVCPDGVPVIPTKPGALGELLNSAPQLLERLSTLTDQPRLRAARSSARAARKRVATPWGQAVTIIRFIQASPRCCCSRARGQPGSVVEGPRNPLHRDYPRPRAGHSRRKAPWRIAAYWRPVDD